MQNYQLRLRDICSEIDRVVSSKEPERFNIYKRSLPVGMDKIILQNLDEEGVRFWLTKLKTHIKNDIVYYYHVLNVNAPQIEKDVYYNPKEIIKNA